MSEAVRPALQITGAVIGGMIGGPIGASIGATIGGAVGGAIAPANVGEGPRLNDLKVVSSTYGQPIPLVYGQKNRLAGNVIWSSELKERRRDREVSKGNEVTEYSYSVDIAVAICEGPVHNITKIWANGEVIWSGDTITAEINQATTDYAEADARATALEADAAACGIEADPDCALLYAQATAARAQANAALTRKSEAEAALVSFDAGGNAYAYSPRLSPGGTFRFYPGDFTQTADPTIQSYKGAGNTPAYRGICYMVIADLQLAAFGNRIPNLEFEVASTATTLRQIVADICERSGMQPYDYSVSLGLDQTVDGYVISREMTSLAALAQLEQAFFFDSLECWGQIRFIKRGGHNKATIDPGDLGARQTHGGATQPIVTTRLHDEALPSRATLTYRDYDRDYQENTQLAERRKGASDHVINASFAITMTSDYARQAVDRLLYEPWVARIGFQAKGHPKFDFLQPADVIGVPVAGSVLPFRLISVVRGADGLIELEARADDPFIFRSTAETQGNAAINAGSTLISLTATFVYTFNAPILDPTESVTAFTWAADSAGAAWGGGRLFRSTDGVTFNAVKTAADRNITGTVAVATPDGPAEIWDRVNSIQVTLLYPSHTLESVSETDVLNGSNAAWIGSADGSSGEVIQFATATLVTSSPRVYLLSDLLRGRRGTEHATGDHGANEVFVLLESAYYRNADYSGADLNATRYYKGVSTYQDADDVVDVQDFVNTGEKARPRSVVHVAGTRDGSNNLTGTFRRRIRGYPSAFGSAVEPLDESTESYEIDILDGATVVRTISVSSETFSYTAAQQTADGLTPGDPVSGNIYQISATVGRGHARSFTI